MEQKGAETWVRVDFQGIEERCPKNGVRDNLTTPVAAPKLSLTPFRHLFGFFLGGSRAFFVQIDGLQTLAEEHDLISDVAPLRRIVQAVSEG